MAVPCIIYMKFLVLPLLWSLKVYMSYVQGLDSKHDELCELASWRLWSPYPSFWSHSESSWEGWDGSSSDESSLIWQCCISTQRKRMRRTVPAYFVCWLLWCQIVFIRSHCEWVDTFCIVLNFPTSIQAISSSFSQVGAISLTSLWGIPGIRLIWLTWILIDTALVDNYHQQNFQQSGYGRWFKMTIRASSHNCRQRFGFSTFLKEVVALTWGGLIDQVTDGMFLLLCQRYRTEACS